MRFGWLIVAATLAAVHRGSAAHLTPPEAVSPRRLEALSRAYLGVPYKLDCLGEGSGPDRDPLYTRQSCDCQTLVEQVLAEALAPSVGGLEPAVRLIRYRGSEVSLNNRYHYCIPDWLQNPWPARDATAKVGGSAVRTLRRRIDRATYLSGRGGGDEARRMHVQQVTTEYIPRAAVGQLLAQIPDGSIIVFVLNRPDIVSGHLGFVFRHGSEVTLRQASQTRHRVIDEPLSTYLARMPRSFIGIKVLQPDVSGLQR